MFPYQLLPGPYKLAIVNSTLSSNVIQYLVFENLRLILGQEKIGETGTNPLKMI